MTLLAVFARAAPVAAAPQGDIWVSDCYEQSTGYTVVCEGYGGRDIERLLPSSCQMGSRLGCHISACDMLDHFTIRGSNGTPLTRADLCSDAGEVGNEVTSDRAADPPSRHHERRPKEQRGAENCDKDRYPELCHKCVADLDAAAGITYFCKALLP